jgi:hypothetical protein
MAQGFFTIFFGKLVHKLCTSEKPLKNKGEMSFYNSATALIRARGLA